MSNLLQHIKKRPAKGILHALMCKQYCSHGAFFDHSILLDIHYLIREILVYMYNGHMNTHLLSVLVLKHPLLTDMLWQVSRV